MPGRDSDNSNVRSASTTTVLEPPSTAPREPDSGRPSLEDQLREIAAQVPAKAWRTVPPDLAYNLDHYLYGAPRR